MHPPNLPIGGVSSFIPVPPATITTSTNSDVATAPYGTGGGRRTPVPRMPTRNLPSGRKG